MLAHLPLRRRDEVLQPLHPPARRLVLLPEPAGLRLIVLHVRGAPLRLGVLPLAVLVHGGPHARDDQVQDPLALLRLQEPEDHQEPPVLGHVTPTDQTEPLVVEGRREALALPGGQDQLVLAGHVYHGGVQRRRVEGAAAAAVELLEARGAELPERVALYQGLQPPRQEGDHLQDQLPVALQQRQQFAHLVGVPHHLEALLHLLLPFLRVQVAHDTQEPRELAELVEPDHAVAAEVEDGGEAPAVVVRDGEGVLRAQLDEHGEQLPRMQGACVGLVELREALAALRRERLAREVLRDLRRQEGDRPVDDRLVVL
mmetsp:Transcript_67925/g.191462  ORF Transcript_67925/g.191462 Transcript_67925/m.191462 type:complete len:314 (+) Transcript_67925:70-1011(+)